MRAGVTSSAPTLSIVTATHQVDRLADLATNIDSLREALLVDVEWVVAIDSEAPLPSLDAIVTRTPRRWGPAMARNWALERVTGTFLANVDHDDGFFPSGMLALLEVLRGTQAGWAAGAAVDVDERGRVIRDPGISEEGPVPAGWARQAFRSAGHFPFHCSATMVRTPLWREVGGWTASYRSEDVHSWLRLTDRSPGHVVGSVCYRWSRHDTQTSEQAWWQDTAGAGP
jgi:hypothetical protein